MMRVPAPAIPIVGAFALAVVAGGVLTRVISPPTPPASATRQGPQPQPQPAWARQVIVADAAEGEALYNEGVGNIPACATCHGAGGLPERGAPYPRLGGQSADYVAKQLSDYAGDIRRNEQMQPIARALNPRQRASVARYVATLKPVPTMLSVAGLETRGRELDEVGDNALGVPGCGNCHGLRGQGEGAMLPPLAGQPQAYLVSQLNAFRAQRRQNDTAEVMEGIASRLSDADIDAVAQYFSVLGPATAAAAP